MVATFRDTHMANRILARLPASELSWILPRLERVHLPPDTVIHGPGIPLRHLYFPLSGIIVLLNTTTTGPTTDEIAMVGNEGVEGAMLLMAEQSDTVQSITQSEVTALRLPAWAARREFQRGGTLQSLLLRFTQALMAQIAQMAVCGRHHTVTQRLCCWLLLSLDRSPHHNLRMTQARIADLLGVRREGITCAAGRLQKEGLLRYSRGHIHVLDRKGLEDHVCECYRHIRGEYRQLLGYGH